MSTSWTVEQLNSDIFVDKTFEQSNLLTWNIVYRAVITRGIQWQNAFHLKTNRSTRFAVFTGLQCTGGIMPGFLALISRKTFCHGKIHFPRMSQNKLKFISGYSRPNFRQVLKYIFFFTLPNSDSGRGKHGKFFHFYIAWHGNAFVTFQKFQVYTITTCIILCYIWVTVVLFRKDQFLTLPNLGFITAHSSLITAQMGSVTPLF